MANNALQGMQAGSSGEHHPKQDVSAPGSPYPAIMEDPNDDRALLHPEMPELSHGDWAVEVLPE